MPKKIIKPVEPIHDERCGDCFYNLQDICKRDPEKCDYNKPVKESKDE